MATVEERVLNRLTKIPGVTSADVARWVGEATNESGITEGEESYLDNALVYLSLHLAYEEISTDAARYFTYTDRDETVDKTNVFENYSKLANQALRKYRYHRNGGTSITVTPERADHR
ncbi:hypothetical protein SAMN05216389_1216 [Oceanobacillus limi]|uniref:Uncharacterized protein n=1 Tax=Oceanobacillus limi TaxID=930131 RepID=A0A1I0GDJ6_9BACI|nr:hypothetical protein [Oceanobacillus limi]SET69111.1 hypothetical protein SAMN05216389_1216 [Oceanobacillus limi]